MQIGMDCALVGMPEIVLRNHIANSLSLSELQEIFKRLINIQKDFSKKSEDGTIIDISLVSFISLP